MFSAIMKTTSPLVDPNLLLVYVQRYSENYKSFRGPKSTACLCLALLQKLQVLQWTQNYCLFMLSDIIKTTSPLVDPNLLLVYAQRYYKNYKSFRGPKTTACLCLALLQKLQVLQWTQNYCLFMLSDIIKTTSPLVDPNLLLVYAYQYYESYKSFSELETTARQLCLMACHLMIRLSKLPLSVARYWVSNEGQCQP